MREASSYWQDEGCQGRVEGAGCCVHIRSAALRSCSSARPLAYRRRITHAPGTKHKEARRAWLNTLSSMIKSGTPLAEDKSEPICKRQASSITGQARTARRCCTPKARTAVARSIKRRATQKWEATSSRLSTVNTDCRLQTDSTAGRSPPSFDCARAVHENAPGHLFSAIVLGGNWVAPGGPEGKKSASGQCWVIEGGAGRWVNPLDCNRAARTRTTFPDAPPQTHTHFSYTHTRTRARAHTA